MVKGRRLFWVEGCELQTSELLPASLDDLPSILALFAAASCYISTFFEVLPLHAERPARSGAGRRQDAKCQFIGAVPQLNGGLGNISHVSGVASEVNFSSAVASLLGCDSKNVAS